jgi:hypothetical protein
LRVICGLEAVQRETGQITHAQVLAATPQRRRGKGAFTSPVIQSGRKACRRGATRRPSSPLACPKDARAPRDSG